MDANNERREDSTSLSARGVCLGDHGIQVVASIVEALTQSRGGVGRDSPTGLEVEDAEPDGRQGGLVLLDVFDVGSGGDVAPAGGDGGNATDEGR